MLAASILDWLIGDPWGWLHPVQVMGWAIAFGQKLILKHVQSQLGQRIAGIGLAIAVITTSASLGWGITQIAFGLNYWLGIASQSILIASCFAARSLRDAAIAVLLPLQQGNLEQARVKLSLYVGRDTDNLDEPEILRAVLETVAENSTDAVIAPLFYAILGGAPLVLAYKAASTLDSMIGYKEEPYTYLGWFSAKLEDALSWLPCRLNVITIALLSGQPIKVWQICIRDAPQDPSPNSGWSECAFAAALGVQLGGQNKYRGLVKTKPLLGNPEQSITPEIIYQALKLMRFSFLLILLARILV